MTKKLDRLKILFVDILTDDKKVEAKIHKKMYRGKTYTKYIESILDSDKLELLVVLDTIR